MLCYVPRSFSSQVPLERSHCNTDWTRGGCINQTYQDIVLCFRWYCIRYVWQSARTGRQYPGRSRERLVSYSKQLQPRAMDGYWKQCRSSKSHCWGMSKVSLKGFNVWTPVSIQPLFWQPALLTQSCIFFFTDGLTRESCLGNLWPRKLL